MKERLRTVGLPVLIGLLVLAGLLFRLRPGPACAPFPRALAESFARGFEKEPSPRLQAELHSWLQERGGTTPPSPRLREHVGLDRYDRRLCRLEGAQGLQEMYLVWGGGCLSAFTLPAEEYRRAFGPLPPEGAPSTSRCGLICVVAWREGPHVYALASEMPTEMLMDLILPQEPVSGSGEAAPGGGGPSSPPGRPEPRGPG